MLPPRLCTQIEKKMVRGIVFFSISVRRRGRTYKNMVPGRCPRSAREVPEKCFSHAFRSSGGRQRANLKKSGQSARGCPTFSVRMVKLPPVFKGFDDQRLFCTGAVVFNGFLRLLKNTAPVQKVRFSCACAVKMSVRLPKTALRAEF